MPHISPTKKTKKHILKLNFLKKLPIIRIKLFKCRERLEQTENININRLANSQTQ